MIPDLFSGEVQHQLISSPHRISFWNLKCPVRMCPVQIAVFGNHLRLDPESELQSQIMNPVDQFSHGTSQLLFIDHPVSKAGIIIISLAKPSVIQNKHFDSKFCRVFSKSQETFPGKIKVIRFPAVYKNRADLIFPSASAQVVSKTTVQIV